MKNNSFDSNIIIIRPSLRLWLIDNLVVMICMLLILILRCMTQGYIVLSYIIDGSFIFLTLLCIYRLIQIHTTKYEITRTCIIIKKGVFTSTEDNIRLSLVIDHRKQRTLLDKLFCLTTYYIYSEDRTNPELIMKGISSKLEFIDELRQRSIDLSQSEGIRRFMSMR